MDYPGIAHFDPSVGTASDEILLYGDAPHYEVTDDGYEFSGNEFVAAGQHFGEDYVDAEFRETRTVFVDGGDRFGVSAVAFDQQEELLWMGNQGGHVTSYYGPGMQKHTSFQVHVSQEIRHISSFDDGVLVLTQNSLRCQMRRGIPIFTHCSDTMEDMQCLLQISPDTILMGGHQEKIIEFNLAECQETNVCSVGSSGCAILRQHGRFICAGDPSGRIELRARNSLRVEHILEAHSGSLSDFDVHGNTLVTCGFSLRQGAVSVDRFLMVYDLRMMRALTPIPVVVDPLLLRFMPSFSSRVAIVSGLGQMQLVDTLAITQQPELYQIDTGGSMCLTFDVSSSCQCMAFGDAGGSLHLYTSNTHTAMFNSFSQETEFADPVEPLPPISIDDMNAALSSIPLPYPSHGSVLLSDWPEELLDRTFRATPAIDPEILRTMKMQGNIGYAPNPMRCRRNQVNIRKPENTPRSGNDTKFNRIIDDNSFIPIPKRYRKLVINYSKYGSDDYELDFYNRTSFSGLEATLPNSYCNPMLQVLYYMSPIRKIILSHMCQKEFCLACELCFLFYMLDVSHGTVCQANNFFRTFRSLPDTATLGLSISDQNPRTKDTDLVSLIQYWHRYVLYQVHFELFEVQKKAQDRSSGSPLSCSPGLYMEPQYVTYQQYQQYPLYSVNDGLESSQIYKDPYYTNSYRRRHSARSEPSGTRLWKHPNFEGISKQEEKSTFTHLLGIPQIFNVTCQTCLNVKSTETTHLVCQLMYPEGGDDKECSFCDVLLGSLVSERCLKSWCNACGKYKYSTHLKRLKDLPTILTINTGFSKALDITSRDKVFWQKQMDLIVQKIIDQGVQSSNMRPCRYGDNCTRSGCKFRHAGRREESSVIGGTKHMYYNNPWVPLHMEVSLTVTGNITIKRLPEASDTANTVKENPEEIVKKVAYDLAAVVCFIEDDNFEKRNLIALVNVTAEYHERSTGSPVSQWYIFNDFSVAPVAAQEAVWYNLDWKIPCIMYWTARDVPNDIVPSVVNPITVDYLLYDSSVSVEEVMTRSYTPLTLDEIPKRGQTVAIDAEFVTLNQEESELRSDGKLNTIKPSLLSVARVSCIRGQGPLEGMAFIDDYISTNEQVVDYLTKFSGIQPGDLDANFSDKHLTTLKTTYLKLRYLIDSGVVFIGHGLKNDFRVINITVPAEQVIDTVVLFHLPRHRMVSLRFLAWHFLGMRIQEGSHDSIEDARTALLLYNVYKTLEEEGNVKKALRKLYEHGREAGWKVPGGNSDADDEDDGMSVV